jgi:hypothetical protein
MKTRPAATADQFDRAVCLQTGIMYLMDDQTQCILLDRQQVTIDTSADWRFEPWETASPSSPRPLNAVRLDDGSVIKFSMMEKVIPITDAVTICRQENWPMLTNIFISNNDKSVTITFTPQTTEDTKMLKALIEASPRGSPIVSFEYDKPAVKLFIPNRFPSGDWGANMRDLKKIAVQSNLRPYRYIAFCNRATGKLHHIIAGCRTWKTFEEARNHYHGKASDGRLNELICWRNQYAHKWSDEAS